MHYKELLVELITDGMVTNAVSHSKHHKDKNIAYNNFLRILNLSIYDKYSKTHDMDVEENVLIWKNISRCIQDVYTSNKYKNHNLPAKGNGEQQVLRTHEYNSYEHVLYLNPNEVYDKLRAYYQLSRTKRQRHQDIDIQGLKVRVSGLKLMTFLYNGSECSCCKTKGTFFTVCKTKGLLEVSHYHLSLWGVDKDNKLVLFTHDHTLARGLGGRDIVDNTTTMCYKCNNLKSLEETRMAADLRRNQRQAIRLQDEEKATIRLTNSKPSPSTDSNVVPISEAILKHEKEARTVILETPAKRRSSYLRMHKR